jgi:DedD protein
MSDDILSNESEYKKDLKKPLIYGAVGFLAFIIIVIAVAIFQNNTSKEENEIVPPAEKNMPLKQETTQFKPLDIEEAPQDIEEKVTQKLAAPKENETIKPVQPKTEQESKDVAKKPELPQEIKLVETKKEIQPQKPIIKKEIKPTVKVIEKGKYYIQVAALLKNAAPNKRFLQLIEKQGFHYELYHTYIIKNSQKIKVTKILIGPFNSKKEAKKLLPKIKRTISQTAFIFKVK